MERSESGRRHVHSRMSQCSSGLRIEVKPGTKLMCHPVGVSQLLRAKRTRGRRAELSQIDASRTFGRIVRAQLFALFTLAAPSESARLYALHKRLLRCGCGLAALGKSPKVEKDPRGGVLKA
jgi:hypothetical protein